MPFLHTTSDVSTFNIFWFVAVRSFTADSSLLQPTASVNTTPHTSHFFADLYAHAWFKSCVWRAHITCHVSSSCAYVVVLTLRDFSTFLSLLSIFSLIINFIFHDVVDKFPVHSSWWGPVSRTTHTNLDVMQESRIDDYWNIDGSRDLSDYWTGFTQFTPLEEKSPDGYMLSGGRLTRRQVTSRPDHLWLELWIKMGRNAKLKEKHKWSNKQPNSIMLKDHEEFISLTLRTRNSKKPLRMLARNWKHQWLPLCLARQARRVSMVRPVVRPMNSNQNLRVSWMPVNPQDCVWKNLYQIIMRTILQEKGNITTIWYTNLFLCLKPWRFPQQRQQWIKIGRNWKRFRRGTWRKSEVRKRWSMKQGRRAQKFILPHWWTYVIERMLNWMQSTKNTKVELYSEAILWKMILDLMQYSLNRDHQHLKWQQQKSWISSPDCQGAQDKQLTQCLLIPRSSMEDPVVPLERNLYGHILAGLLWEKQFEKILLKYGWEKVFQLGILIRTPWTRVVLICVCGWHKIGWKETKH